MLQRMTTTLVALRKGAASPSRRKHGLREPDAPADDSVHGGTRPYTAQLWPRLGAKLCRYQRATTCLSCPQPDSIACEGTCACSICSNTTAQRRQAQPYRAAGGAAANSRLCAQTLLRDTAPRGATQRCAQVSTAQAALVHAQANMKMHAAMALNFTGNPSVDLLLGEYSQRLEYAHACREYAWWATPVRRCRDDPAPPRRHRHVPHLL